MSGFSTTKIAVIGSTMMDLTVYADVLPAAGETRFGNSFTTGFGGKGANQAVMAARTGAKVTMITGIGSDGFGDESLANFKNCGMDTSSVLRLPTHTGVAHIWVDGEGQNRISIVPGANFALTPQDAVDEVSKLKDVSVLIAQCEIPQEVTLAAFRTAQELGITTILNPAPYQPLTDDLLELTDWLIPNEIEFAELDKTHRAPDSDSVIASLRSNGRTIVTLGSDGAALVTADGSVKRFAAKKVSATDTTGAGDCFIGAFAAALASGATEESAVQFGIDCATKSVTRKGAQSSYPTIEEIDFSLIAK
ncbi:MAG: ribokinase [Actinobacteria bacterium]|jgi:ribokinase|uniref:Ribokinase n=1 Tax=freshwater metagenome TaxID=449393 RepID=A0A6J7U0E4_9ZZZZ|nr:ribokinase [Actinomycetota bacterium]MTA49289.1 ribokinase [Actinomycetota bacterium]